MIPGIKRDHARFKQIVKGKIKQNLKKYITQGEMIGRQGKDYVSIPIAQIDLPRFKFGKKQMGGVGQGDGSPGTPIGAGEEEGEAQQAGNQPGKHELEVDVSLQELADMLGQELELPNIQPKRGGSINSERYKFSGVHNVGPDSLRHHRRTFKEALKRQLITGQYNPENPVIIPIKQDFRYRVWKKVQVPENNALIIYMMDVSGSMGDEQKEIVRTESFWIDTWLRSQYKGIEIRYIIHDATAREVDQKTFYHTRESGGTLISSAYRLCNQIIEKDFPVDEWNIYAFHFSDGDNWSGEDTKYCVQLLKEQLLPKCNQFCYGQVESRYGSGQFIKDLTEHFKEAEKVVTSKIESKEAIYRSLKDFSREREMRRELPEELLRAHTDIREIARGYGLDTFEIIFELVDYDEINEIAALGGFPTRYPHWRHGMEYDYLNKGYTYGLQKIYELVINTDPCYAYLQTGNMIVDQKLVMAHVYGHCDFFKNNMWFAKTNRKMLDQMANHATRIREYQDRFGVDVVEDFIDCCSSIDNLIDQYSPFVDPKNPEGEAAPEGDTPKKEEGGIKKLDAKGYMDSYVNPKEFIEAQKEKMTKAAEKASKFPAHPERDVLKFLRDFAPLQPWQQDVLSIVREEAYYFAPQGQTKILNEGWASYWHSTIMTNHVLKDSEVIDYADHHAGTLGTRPGQINPYKLGIELLRDIEDRWNRGKFGKEYDECEDLDAKRHWDKKLGLGREKIFEVRKLHNDVTFIDSFLNEEFANAQKLFTYAFNRRTGMYEIVDRDWQKVKRQLLFSLTNHGQPIIRVEDANYANRGELLLVHDHEGIDLDYDKSVETLKSIQAIWGRPVNLQTKYNTQAKILAHDGKEVKEKDA